jgi:hypothetical protein
MCKRATAAHDDSAEEEDTPPPLFYVVLSSNILQEQYRRQVRKTKREYISGMTHISPVNVMANDEMFLLCMAL